MVVDRKLSLLLGLLSAIPGPTFASPPVKVSLRTSWPAPPPLVEILETISLENQDAFFPLLDRLTDPEEVIPPMHTLTPEATQQAALQVAAVHGFLSEPGALASVQLNLALHVAVPKIEAFYSHHDNVAALARQRHMLRPPNTGNGQSTAKDACGSWVEWYGEVVCDVETLARLAGTETIDDASGGAASKSANDYARPKLLTFDHVYPPPGQTLKRPLRTAIFYASLDSANFRELHSYLLALAQKGPVPHVEYVLRFVPPVSRVQTDAARSYLSGYGVALDLKKMDYLAVDDRNVRHSGDVRKESSSKNEEFSDVDPVLDLIHAHPVNETGPGAKTPLSEDELLKIGLQAAQLIADSDDPLSTLTLLSQNFPKYTTPLARRVVVNSSIEAELETNSNKVQPGAHALWLNGAVVPDKDVNPFALLRLLRKERGLMTSLTNLGLTRPQALRLLTHSAVGDAQGDKNVLDGLFDASDRPEGGDVITWWNDLEKDSRYDRWPNSLYILIRPMFPGQFPSVRLNLFNIVLAADLSHLSTINFIATPMANIINRSYPFRFGVVPIVETEQGTQMARLFYYLIKNYGRKKTLQFLKKITAAHAMAYSGRKIVELDVLRQVYNEFASEEGSDDAPVVDLDVVLKGEATPLPPFDKLSSYAERLGTSLATSPTGHAFINGKHYEMGDDFFPNMQMEVSRQLQFLQERACFTTIYAGKLTDEHNATVATYFYDQPSTSVRRNKYINPVGGMKVFNIPELFSRIGFRAEPSLFVYPPGTQSVPLTFYIVADLDSEDGLQFAKEALTSMDDNSRARISLVHNPSTDPTETTERSPASWLISHLLSNNLLSKSSPAQILHALGFETQQVTTQDGHVQTILSRDDALLSLTGNVPVSAFNATSYEEYTMKSRLLARELGLAPGESALLSNGRVLGPVGRKDFLAPDFTTLEAYEMRRRTDPVVKALEDTAPSTFDPDRASFAHLVSMASSVISAIQQPDPSEFSLFDAPPRPRSLSYKLLESTYTAFHFGNNSTALYHIAVVVDPLSEIAQRWTSLLNWLSNIPDVYIEVHMNPTAYREIPLKRFYRYNLLPNLSFDEDGREIAAQTVFNDLPMEPIYTLAMDVHQSWLVRPRLAHYDLDNIQLGHLFSGDSAIDAVFDLDYLVVEGHAREGKTNTPPRGLQLQLVGASAGTETKPIDDTQVVANLGYLQFKVKPGVFRLEIRPGRGRNIFKIDSVGNEGWDSPTIEEAGSEITVTDFEGLTLFPRFSRLPGMETAEVLEEPSEQESGGIFEDIASRVTSLFKKKQPAAEKSVAERDDQADINIFTVASGLLYERFASIMILSVLRNTKSTVKFWFIENFLSPSFLEFIPHMAEAYNFKYELVTYKWPSWLRAQTEKQRIIWAYKILFLDVLFPMDLKKVIFVDADQIVRADLKELVDLDLHGAPYGYTPMGDDNYEMEGFRFWKTGYWEKFLDGKPYHISALYVVDLVRFRQLAAGDILRGSYQQLSADPNSLANLDQDLPNNLQNEVPIYSLHEDWLWCETWCSKDRLHRAKTIDLCQNPLTKEPKLSRARKIPEWEEYDAEIARFARKLAEEGKIQSNIAATDANVLANAGSVPNPEPDSADQKEDVIEDADRKDEGTESRPRDEL